MSDNRSAEWFLAICQDCTPALPMPFYDQAECSEWGEAHSEGTGHKVRYEDVTISPDD